MKREHCRHPKSPIRVQPFAVAKPWGGEHLSSWQGAEGSKKIGELILLSSIKEFPTYIAHPDAPEKKQTFQSYWQKRGYQKAVENGSRRGAEHFPLLLKLLSTQEPLSIQVHPSTQDLKEKFDIRGTGKFESWVILKAEEKAKIFFGLKEQYTQNDLLKIKTDDDPLHFFNSFSSKQGDIFQLEPGLIHGTSGSLLFFEIQQPSDHTFRIYDFGRGRELHLESAQKVIKKKLTEKSDWSKKLENEHFSLKIRKAMEIQDYVVEKPYEVITYFGPNSSVSGSFGKFSIDWGSTFLVWRGTSLSFDANSSTWSTEDSSGFKPSFDLPLLNLSEARLFISSE